MLTITWQLLQSSWDFTNKITVLFMLTDHTEYKRSFKYLHVDLISNAFIISAEYNYLQSFIHTVKLTVSELNCLANLLCSSPQNLTLKDDYNV